MIDPVVGPGDDVVEGERIGVSPLTGTVYRVTRWVEGSEEDQLRALAKEPLSEEEISELAPEVRSWVEEERAESGSR